MNDSDPQPDSDSQPDLFSQATREHVPAGESGEPTDASQQLFSMDSLPPARPLPPGLDMGSNASGLAAGPIPTELGRFHHIEVVKSGGFGIVCRAQDSQAGRVVALKFPRQEKLRDASDLQMFVDEANRAMELDHPGIVKTYSVETSAGLLAIVQEFIEGSDLRSLQPDFTNHQVIATLVAKIAEALSYAHRRGIYHRDLKPANILIDRRGNPYITDFGLALHEREQLFLPKQRCGTPHYMPPELVAGLTRRLDGRSDIWSLGVILYELLTKRKPFQGVNEQEIYEQIETNDPRPPRQIDPTIDRELQRICMKCLERQQRDRYPTADDLADDLRHWVANPSGNGRSVGSKFVARGLRPFTVDDADFFLELLPGSRDRHGLPTSIKFWLNRIVPPIPVDRVTPVGILFGPSGSGKSSFVKAGLLPLLGADVLSVYVDCSLLETEQKLLRYLLESLEKVPQDIPLVDLCAGLSQGLWRPRNKTKVLLVLDQLEQRLARGDDYLTSNLSKALRYCDGRVLQSLLICRDDYLMSLSRFTASLGLDVREGENAQAIDLFDRKHARSVLVRYGQACGQLADAPGELTEAQEDFLQAVVTQLSVADYVVCVQLVLFAEMFRDRPWTIAELDAIGGVAGTGEKFLETMFGPSGRDKRLRELCPLVEQILAALLPPAGTDMRGGSKTLLELQQRINTRAEQLEPTLKILDERLKLITSVESEVASGDVPTGGEKRYHLGHDSLITSIRLWLERQWGRTAAGRAQLQLRELGRQVIPGQAPRYLPSHWEWLTWQWRLPANLSRTLGEQAVWRAAKRRFLQHLTIAGALAIVVAGGVWLGWSELDRQRRIQSAHATVEQLVNHEYAALPEVLQRIDAQAALTVPKLRQVYEQAAPGSAERFRAALGLLGQSVPPAGSAWFRFQWNWYPGWAPRTQSEATPQQLQSELLQAIATPNLPPTALAVIIDRLQAAQVEVGDELERVANDARRDPRARLRALVARLYFEGPTPDWLDNGSLVVTAFAAEPSESRNDWLELLRPAAVGLEPIWMEHLVSNQSVSPAALAWGGLRLSRDQPAVLRRMADQLVDCRDEVYSSILEAVEREDRVTEFRGLLQEKLAAVKDDWSRAALSVAVARLGQSEELIRRLAADSTSVETILAIAATKSGRLRTFELQQIYAQLAEPLTAPLVLRRSLLLAFAQHAEQMTDDVTRAWLGDVAREHIEQDLDACCFSASELIRRRLGYDGQAELRRNRRQRGDERGILGNVLIDQTGLAFSLIEVPASESTVRLGVCTQELSAGHIQDFLAAMDPMDPIYGPTLEQDRAAVAESAGPDYPFLCLNRIRDLRLAYRYCNWLSQQNGIAADFWAYPTDLTETKTGSAMVQSRQPSFRLLTAPEWTQSAKSADALSGLLGDQSPVISDYAWSIENSRVVVQPVATRLPDSAGLFDMFGNVGEICHAPTVSSPQFVDLGNTVRAQHAALRNQATGRIASYSSPLQISNLHTGFRVAVVVP